MTAIMGPGTPYVRPTDNSGLPIYTREENAARWAQAQENGRAREADPSLRDKDTGFTP